MYEAALQWFDLPSSSAIRVEGVHAWDMVLAAGIWRGQGLVRTGVLLQDDGTLGAFATAGRTPAGAVVITEDQRILLDCLWRDEDGLRALVHVTALPVSTVQGGRAWALQDHDVEDYRDQVWLRHARSPEGGWDVAGAKGVQPQGRREDLLALSIEAGVPVFGWDARRGDDPSFWLGKQGGALWTGVVTENEVPPSPLYSAQDEPAGQLIRVSRSLRLNLWIGSAWIKPDWAAPGTPLWGHGGRVEVRSFPLVPSSQD
jgi:hypothetical protein